MKPIVQLYVTRMILGLVAATLSAVVAALLGNPQEISTFLNSLTIALLIYLGSYYLLKVKYKNLIEKQSKILSTGIGMYFFTWIAFFILFYTIITVIVPAA